MGVDFFLKEVILENDRGESSPAEAVRVQLWDIAGQDRAKKMHRVSGGGRESIYEFTAAAALLRKFFWQWEGGGFGFLPTMPG